MVLNRSSIPRSDSEYSRLSADPKVLFHIGTNWLMMVLCLLDRHDPIKISKVTKRLLLKFGKDWIIFATVVASLMTCQKD